MSGRWATSLMKFPTTWDDPATNFWRQHRIFVQLLEYCTRDFGLPLRNAYSI
jgi:hypothetical protein